METLRKTLTESKSSPSISLDAVEDSFIPSQKTSRSVILHSVTAHLLKSYVESPSSDDVISAEEIHHNVNKSDEVPVNVSFITTTRLVKSTFKRSHYDRDTKAFKGLSKLYSQGVQDVNDPNIKYTQPRWGNQLLHGLAQLRDSWQLCDAVIICNNGPHLHAHACVLASASQLLLTKFLQWRMRLDPSEQNNKMALRCDSITYQEWNDILQYIYHGKMDLCVKNIMRMWVVARYLCIQSMANLLENSMREQDIFFNSKLTGQFIDLNDLVVTSCDEIDANDLSENLPLDFSIKYQHDHDSSNEEYTDINVKSEVVEPNPLNEKIEEAGASMSDFESTGTSSQGIDDHEPKSKRRKMYVPRKVSAASPKSSENARVLGSVMAIAKTKTIEVDPNIRSQFIESAVMPKSPEQVNNAHDSYGPITSRRHEQENSHHDSPEPNSSRKKRTNHNSKSNEDNDPNCTIKAEPVEDAYTCDFFAVQPLVIEPLDGASSPRAATAVQSPLYKSGNQIEGETSGRVNDNSLLYDLLSTRRAQQSQDTSTPASSLLKSLLAPKAMATLSPNTGSSGLKANIPPRPDSEPEAKSCSDPDYRPSKKKKKKLRAALASKIAGNNAAPYVENAPKAPLTIAELMPRPLSPVSVPTPNTFTWNAEDLARERQRLGGDADQSLDLSASSLLLSMINKATPKKAIASDDDVAKQVSSQVFANLTDSQTDNTKQDYGSISAPTEQAKDLRQTLHTSYQDEIKQIANSQASNILVSLLAKKNNAPVLKPPAAQEIDAPPPPNENKSSTNRELGKNRSPGAPPMRFSQVLQGMASAYSISSSSSNHPINSSKHSCENSKQSLKNIITQGNDGNEKIGTESASASPDEKASHNEIKERAKERPTDRTNQKSTVTRSEWGSGLLHDMLGGGLPNMVKIGNSANNTPDRKDREGKSVSKTKNTSHISQSLSHLQALLTPSPSDKKVVAKTKKS